MSQIQNDDPKLVFTFREAWKVSGLGRSYLLEAVHDGRLKVIRAGRAYRVPRAELERFIEAETRAALRAGRDGAAS